MMKYVSMVLVHVLFSTSIN